MVLGIRAALGTGVLATVHCPAWKVCWMRQVIHTLLDHHAIAGILCLHAVKGGPNTDMEVRVLEEALPLLGFTTREFRTEWPTNLFWRWTLERPDGPRYQVQDGDVAWHEAEGSLSVIAWRRLTFPGST